MHHPWPECPLPPEAPSLSQRLLELAANLRQPVNLTRCASELEGLAARATWASELTTRQINLAWQLGEVAEKAATLAHDMHVYALRTYQLLEGVQGVTDPSGELKSLRPDSTGRYGWDRWQASALAAGLEKELATLGRAVMREAAQHDWEPELKAECGWSDAGRAMLELARRDPDTARARWQHLLETDGERGRWNADGSWQPL